MGTIHVDLASRTGWPRSEPDAIDAFIRKLDNYQRLTEEDRQHLRALPLHVRRMAPRAEIISESQTPRGVNLVLSGFAFRFKLLPDGRRQILGYFVPGDLCDLRVALLKTMDHSLATLTRATLATLNEELLHLAMDSRPRVAKALWVGALVQEAVTREWLISLGRRTAYERMAHLFCEIYARLAAVGLASRGRCEWPITQPDLADSLGLSTVHVNRTLQDMRRAGLIRLQGRDLEIPDPSRLYATAQFDPAYLRLPKGASGQLGRY